MPAISRYVVRTNHFRRVVQAGFPGTWQKRERKIMEEDARKEAAMAAAACLQPNFVPKKITPAQLSKFQELHKRRLQIKERSKPRKKIKGNGKSHYEKKDINVDKATNAENQEGATVTSSKGSMEENSGSTSASAHPVSTLKRKKLHWGLDTKERWEMKANM